MIPDSMLNSNPTMGERSKELAEKNICRICLIHTDRVIDKQWNTVLSTCFTASAGIAEKLPKYVCVDCSEFLQKCNDFKEMYKKSELILVSYPLTGTLPKRVEVPSWLRQKRKLPETASIRVRSSDLLPVKSTLQSPTITSEIGAASPLKVQKVLPSSDNVPTQILQQSITPDRSTVIQEMQTYVEMYQHSAQITQQYQYQSSPVFPSSTQPPRQYPVLEQRLLQPSLSTSINHQNLIPLTNQNQQPHQTLPQKSASQQPLPQPSQQSAIPSSVPVYQCKACCYMFLNQHHLLAHTRKHAFHGEYRCGCGRPFRAMHDFVNHLKQHSTISWCDLCGEQFADRHWELGPHLDRHVQVGLAEACDFCSLVFIDLQSRIRHVGSCHEVDLRQTMELNGGEIRGQGTWGQ